MEVNRWVRQLIWDGAIPLEIHLNDPENILTETTTTTTKLLKCPFYMMARRLLYFPILVNEIKRHFGSISRSTGMEEAELDDELMTLNDFRSASTSKSSISQSQSQSRTNFSWFTCKIDRKVIILPSHLQIGLIYDLVKALSSGVAGNDLPWRLEFHISNSNCCSYGNELIYNNNGNNYNNNNNNNNGNNYNTQVNINNKDITPLLDEVSLSSLYFSSLKEADHLRSGSAKNVMNLTRSEQLQLWDSLKEGDCFKFWRINQKLISSPATTRSVPLKFWIVIDEREIVRLQFPIQQNHDNNNNNNNFTLKNILKTEFDDCFIERIKEVSVHGVIFPSLDIEILELSSNWAFSDNFINLLIKLN